MKKLLRFLFFGLCFLALIVLIGVIAWLSINRNNGQIISNGEKRKYLLYVPERYDPAVATPLVITIHGFAQWPANQMNVSQWNELADQHGFIVVYPSGTGFPLRWRVSDDPNNPGGPGKEIAFFSDLIDKLADEYNIDSSRIYANGLSNGAGMALLLACQLSDRVTAIGGVAGAYFINLEGCQPNRPVPAIFFHGKKDEIVPYDGGPSERFAQNFLKIPEFAHSYAQKNGCESTPTIVMETDNVSGVRYYDCTGNADVILYTIYDGGHTWPGGSPLPKWITGKTSQEIHATRLMWEFFLEFSIQK